MNKKNRGYISIFLALIIMPVYSFAILGIDISKLMALKNQSFEAGEIVLSSILSEYDKLFYEKYNIFSIENNADFKDKFANLLQENLEYNDDNFYKSDLVNFDLEIKKESKIIGRNLEKQILDYMRLKMPIKATKGLLKLINLTMNQKKYNKSLEKKLDYDDAYNKMNGNIEKLGKLLETYDNNYKRINYYLKKMNFKLKLLSKEVEKIDQEISSIQMRIDIQSKDKSDKNKDYETKIRKLKDKKLSMFEKYNEENEKMLKELNDFKYVINEIIKILNSLSKNSENLKVYLNEWKKSVDSLENSDVKTAFKSEYKNANQKITKENIDKLLSKVNEIPHILENFIKYLKNHKYYKITDQSNLLDVDVNDKITGSLPSMNKYKLYKYSIDSINVKEVSKKERKKAKSKRKDFKKFNKKIKNISELSNKHKITDFIARERIEKILDVSNSDGGSTIYSDSNIKNYKKILKQMNDLIPDENIFGENLYDNILLAEYINDKFSNKLSKSDKGFINQVEYIIFGNENLDRNNSYVSNSIFGIRFALNSVYAFTNPKLIKEATTIAVAISGWTAFGVPLVKGLILGSMSFGESILDLEKINTGKNLEAYKNNSTWQVSVTSLPNLLRSKLRDFSHSAINNIFETIDNYSEKNLDKLESYIDEFVNQSIDGISQSIISTIITPIQQAIERIINQPIEKIDDTISNVVREIEDEIDSEQNILVKDIKKKSLNLVKEKFIGELENNIEKIKNDVKYFDDYFTEMTKNIEKKIRDMSSGKIESFKQRISLDLEKGKEKAKETVDKFLKDFGLEENGKNLRIGGFSGISFNYSDYLRLITFFRICTSNKNLIIRRIALVMDYEMKKLRREFDITNLYTAVRIKFEIDVNTLLINKIFRKNKNEFEFTGAYQ